MIEIKKLYYHKMNNDLSFFWMDRIEGKIAYGWQISFVQNRICHFFLNDKIPKYALDLGSGGGLCAINFAKLGSFVTGLEISSTAVKLANENLEIVGVNLDGKAEFYCEDILYYDTNKFKDYDLIYLNSVLHCFGKKQDRIKLYENIKNSLKSDGDIFISTLLKSENFENDERIRIDENNNLVAKDYYRIFFDFDYLVKELNENGLEVKSYQISKQFHENDLMNQACLMLRKRDI